MKFIYRLLGSSVHSCIFIFELVFRFIEAINARHLRVSALTINYSVGFINPIQIDLIKWVCDGASLKFFSVPGLELVDELLFGGVNVGLQTLKFLFESLELAEGLSVVSLHVLQVFEED